VTATTTLSPTDRSMAELPNRRLSPGAVPSGRAATIFGRQTRGELLKLLRAPDFVAPVVLLPVLLYALFGGPNLGIVTDDGLAIGPILTASFTAYGVLGIMLFTFGEAVASERGMGWLRLVRATPLPGWAFIGAKLAAGMALVGLLVAIMVPASIVLGAGVSPEAWVRLGLTVVVAGLALAPIGFLVGFLVRPSAAGAVALLVYLPLSFASGMWTPVDAMPAPVQAIAPYLPTYHFNALAHAAVGLPTPDLWVHVAWLVGTFIVAGGSAVWAYRRIVGRQFA
jgi:ABC-2 type transport system permease protein